MGWRAFANGRIVNPYTLCIEYLFDEYIDYIGVVIALEYNYLNFYIFIMYDGVLYKLPITYTSSFISHPSSATISYPPQQAPTFHLSIERLL